MQEPESGRENGVDLVEMRARLDAREDHVRALHDELARARLAADEAVAARKAQETRAGELEAERDALAERLRGLEGEGRQRWRRREKHERRSERMEREIARLEGELERGKAALEESRREARDLRKRLEERDPEISRLRATVEALEEQLEEEYEARRSLANPQNRLRAGIEVFNDSEQLRVVHSISKSFGRPEVFASLEDGEEPPVSLTFAWRDMTWQTYHANPGLEVEEPRVYLHGSGDDMPEDHGPPNASIGSDGWVRLGF